MMIKLATNQFAIRSIIHSNVECEWGKVKVILDEVSAMQAIQALYKEIRFASVRDDSFIEIDNIRVSGQVDAIYDPDYSYIIKLYYSASSETYALTIEA